MSESVTGPLAMGRPLLPKDVTCRGLVRRGPWVKETGKPPVRGQMAFTIAQYLSKGWGIGAKQLVQAHRLMGGASG
jgi:hypothetical protein